MNTYLKLCFFLSLYFISSVSQAVVVASYDIRADNWLAAGGGNTYTSTVSGLTVSGTADQIISSVIDPTAVFSGNDNPVILRNFTYTLPPPPVTATSCTVSLDFFHLSNNSTGVPESVGDFTPAPDTVVLGVGHSFASNAILGSGPAVISLNTTTLSWNLPGTLSFNVPATGGNPTFAGHRNLVIDCIFPAAAPSTIPTLGQWALFLLAGLMLMMGAVWFLRHQHN